MTIAAASPSQKVGNAFGAASGAVAYPNNVATGSLLVAAFIAYTGTTNDPPTAADLTQTAGTATIGPVSLDRVETRDIGPGVATVHVAIYSAIVLSGGSLTFTGNGGASGVACLLVMEEFTGNWGAGRLVSSNSATGNSSAPSSGSTGSTGPAVFFGALMHVNATTGSAATEDGAYTLIAELDSTPTQLGASVIEQIVSGITVDAADWTTSASTDWIAALAVYQEEPPVVPPRVPTLSSAGADDITTTSARPKVTITW